MEIYIEYLRDKTIFKEVSKMTFDELKTAFNSRLREKAKAHEGSVFQRFWDEEMVWIQEEIKLRRGK